MKIKHIMLISLLLVILTIGSASGADNVTDNALSTTTDDIVSLENDSQEILGDGEGNFNDLSDAISATDWGDTLSLSKDYKFGTEVMSPYGIYSNTSMTIEGNNHTIDAAGQCNVFTFFQSNVTLQNINFKNVINTGTTGGVAIDLYGDYCNIINCSFDNCAGPVRIRGDNCRIDGCSFSNCTADSGGAIIWMGKNGTLKDSRFVTCNSYVSGGAISWSGAGGLISGCSFRNSSSASARSISVSTETLTIQNSVFEDNTTDNFTDVVNGGDIISCTFNGNSIGRTLPKTFTDLQNLIDAAGSTLTLTNDFIYTAGDSSRITINKTITINGNGHTIDGAGNASAFEIDADNVGITDINFKNCRNATGGAININNYQCSIANSTFTNCSADNGGAININVMQCSITNCTFISCSANTGGATKWNAHSGTLTDSTFINCSANYGGAIYTLQQGSWFNNCNFINCHAAQYGGAIHFNDMIGNVINCNFTNCSADIGGAIYNRGDEETILNCSFVECHASTSGGAVYSDTYDNHCKIDTSEFINSTAAIGSAVYDNSNNLEIKNSNFVDNSAAKLSDVIYGGIISNCTLNGNMPADVDLEISIASNLTEACQIGDSIEFTVTVTNKGSTDATGAIVTIHYSESLTIKSRDTVKGSTRYGNSTGELIWTIGNMSANETATLTLTVQAMQAGNSTLIASIDSAVNDTNSMNNMAIDMTSVLAKASTLTIDTNITGSIVTLTFTVPEDATGNISVTVGDTNYVLNPVNGTSILNLNLTAGDYLVSATYGGDAQYKSANNETSFTVPATSENTFNDLKNLIDAAGPTLTLTDDFIYSTGDSGFITINKTITIDGNGHTLDANNKSRIFIIYADGVTLKNIVFKNGNISDYGGAVEWFGANGTISNSNFTNCYCSENGGAVHWKNGANGTISNSNFTNCYAKIGGGAVHWQLGANGIVYNSTFINCSADVGAGAVQWDAGANGTVSNSRFINCSAGIRGGAVEWYYWFESEGAILNSIFINCFAGEEGGAVEWYGVNGTIDDSKFINCSAANDGGAVHWSGTNGTISDSIFINCSAGNGGVLYWLKGANGILSDSIFINCSAANDGGAVYWRELYDGDNGTLSNSIFINCSANGNGSAIFWSSPNGTIENSDFSQFDASKNHVIYVTSNNTIISACDFVNENITQLDEVIYGGTVVDCTINGNSQKFIDLSITMTSNATICQIGDSIEFTVTVTNNGPSDATGTYVSLIYPDMAIQNSYNTVNGSVGPGNSSGEMYWTIGNLPAGQTATLAIIGEPVELGNITYALTAYSSVNDTDTTNNAAYSLISVIAKASTLTIDTNINGNNVTLTFTIPADATGNISVIVYGMNYVLNPVSGISTLNRNFTAGEYLVLATYSGDANYMPTTANKTFTVGAIAGNTFTDLQNLIDAAGSTLNLTDDYIYSTGDSDFITIDKTITIDGAGHTINGNNTQRAFLITADNVVLKNINFDHCRLGFDYGGTIYWQGNNGTLTYCNFTNCYGTSGSSGPIYWQGDDGKLTACNFVNCTSTETPGGAINWFGNNGTVANSRFTNCSSTYGSGGVINWGNTSGIIEKSDFTTFEAQMEAHALYLSNDNIIVRNCRFNDERYESFNEIIIGGNVIDCTLNGNAPIKIIDLSLIINSNITSCNIGDMIEITVVANNAGPDDATGAYVTLDCPISLSIKSQDTIKGSAGYGNGTGDLIWTIGNLTSGESATLTITAQAIQTGNMTLTGSISANENDENAANNMALTQITSLVKASTLTIDANITGNNVTLTFTLKENNNTIQNEIINIMIGDANFNKTTDENGMCIITSNFPAGEYQVSATFGGNDFYMAAQNETTFTVMATNTFTYLQKLIDESGQTLALTNDFIYSAGDSGQIIINKTVTIDGAGHTIDANHQSRIFTITADEVILKNINFKNGRETANGGSIYWSGNSGRLTNCSFTDSSSDANGGAIYWQGADGKVEDSRFTDCSALQKGGSIYWIGSNGTVSNSAFTNKNESKAAIHATSNDVEIIKSNFDRKSAVEGGTMKQCTYDEIEAKNATEITLTANNIEIGDFQIIEANLEGNTTGNITFEIYKNNTLVKTSTAAIIGGSASIVISNLGIGNYRVEAIYPGDESYNETSKSTTFKVRPKVTISQGVSVGSKTNIYIDFGENITDTLIVKIDKKTFAVLNIEKGIVNYTFSTAKLKEGNREVTIDYEGDLFDKTLITSESYDMYLIPEEIPIPEEIKSTDDGVVTLEFPINATGTLTVYIDGEAQEIIDVGKELKKFIAQSNKTVEEIVIGLLKINLSKYKGNYTITFEYSGDENYQAFEKEANATIYVNPAIIQASNANVLYSAGPTYTIKVYSDKNVLAKSGKVIIKANNKAFKTLTIKNGIASFKVTQVPGTYKLTISALGKTKTTTLTVKHVVTLKTVTVKRSAKKLVLQATLSKVNKKYLKNKKIAFKFNGKTYKAKTNKKGVAKVTIKSTVLKKLKVGKKVTYQATYLKDTVKKTAKIKK